MATIPQTQVKSDPSEFAWKTVAAVLPFLVFFWVNIAHHMMFFDEVNAWAISAASPTLSKLFYYVHFEGHPWLWYFILWFPSRLTHDPIGLKWVEAAVGTSIILVLGSLSPFTYSQRALILSSYFLVWEYTVMCRMYSVMLLLVLIYLVRRARSIDGVVVNCALLGLAANTDMTGVLLASALLVEYVHSSWMATATAARKDLVRRWTVGLAVCAGLIALSVGTLWPSKQISWQSSGHIGSSALNRHRIQVSIGNVVAAPWWPISRQFPHHFWETTTRDAHWLYLLMPIVLFVYWRTFRRESNLLLLMGAALAFGALFADFVYEGHVRHWGITFVAFVAGLWIQSAHQRYIENRRPRWPVAAYALLGLSAVAGGVATVGSWAHPFSRARETAMWLKQSYPPNAPIVGDGDVTFASVAEEMQRPVYFLECGCVDTFKLFSKDREMFPEADLAQRFDRAMNDLHTPSLIFVFYRPLNLRDLGGLERAGLTSTPIRSFTGADADLESYWVYDVRRAPLATPRTHTGNAK